MSSILLEKNKIFGTEQNPKNGVPQGGTEIIFERNTSLLEAAKKCLERRRKTDFSKKDNKNIIDDKKCSTFLVPRERNSGTEPKNSVPRGGTEAVFEGPSLLLEAARKCLERHRKTDFFKQDNRDLTNGQSCSAFFGERNSEAAIQNAVPVGITDAILWGNTNETAASSSVCYKSLEERKIPTIWQEAIKHTLQRKRPENITEQKWQAIINQIQLWLNQDLTQLQKIINDGWSIQDIFGCHKRCPERRTDRMGLLMLIQGKTIERVNMGAIALKTSSGVEQCFYKNILNSPEAALICNLEQGSNAENRTSSTPPSNSSSCTDKLDTSDTIESIAAVIDKAGLKNLSKWIKPTSNNPTGINLNLKLGEQQKVGTVTQPTSPVSSIISSSYSSLESFITDLEKAGVSIDYTDERLQIDASRLMAITNGSTVLSNIIEEMKVYMSSNKDNILKYFQSAAPTIN
jgi:hypothetical protein